MENAMELVEQLLGDEPVAEKKLVQTHTSVRSEIQSAAGHIVNFLLEEKPQNVALVIEASLHRSARSRVWNAVFTGPGGGQVSRSTGLTDRDQALLIARKWEAKARAERARLGTTSRKPILRAGQSRSAAGVSMLTQQEVAQLLHMSERGVREVERRAFRKIRNHPLMRQIWQKYLSGELDEHQPTLTQDEIEAVFHVARTPEEWSFLLKVLRLIRGS